jgi:hypothetical protein
VLVNYQTERCKALQISIKSQKNANNKLIHMKKLVTLNLSTKKPAISGETAGFLE